MFSKVVRTSEAPVAEPSYTEYDSQILRLFVDEIGKEPDINVLDIGRIYGANISFFTRRVKKLFVCDMFLRLARNLHEGIPPGQALKHLDYPPESFDGILLWELLDRLDETEGGKLVELCHKMMRPGGRLVLFARSEQAASDAMNSYVIRETLQLEIHPHPRIKLPLYYRQNRDIMKLLAPFTSVKSFIYRSGLREFLFQNG